MGYIGQSRSENSQMAINEGLVTYSQLTAWQKRAVDVGAVNATEWHHTGKYFNQTDYFDPQDFENLNSKDFPKVQKKVENDGKWYVLVSAEWGGTRNYPKITGASVVVKNYLTKSQIGAKKYYYYGGYIKEFTNKNDAIEFSKTAELN